jgi:hypothetical protein
LSGNLKSSDSDNTDELQPEFHIFKDLNTRIGKADAEDSNEEDLNGSERKDGEQWEIIVPTFMHEDYSQMSNVLEVGIDYSMVYYCL